MSIPNRLKELINVDDKQMTIMCSSERQNAGPGTRMARSNA